MRRRLSTRARGNLSRGALISLLLHFNVVAPVVIAAWVYGGRQEAQRAEEVDVAFQAADQTELPPDLPPIEPSPEKLEPEAKKAPKPDKKRPELVKVPKPEAQKKPELAKKEKPEKPEPEVVAPPMPPMPPPPPERKGHEKMVDLDNDKDVPPPPDAKFLAQKNNRVDVETRAEDTNMVKAQKGQGEASSKSERDDKQVGGDKAKVAQLEEEKSKLGRSAPEVTPHQNPELSQPKDQPEHRDRSLLALRDPTPKQHELTPETADLSLPHAADGEMPLPSHAARGTKSDPSHLDNAKRVKLAFTAKDYEYLFGADAAAERKLAQQTRSTRQGKFQKRLARVQSAVENFIPEVKPGNQTALNTRAAPFAAYLARMHRSIHELWGFGQLEEWDEKPGSSPYNNRNLVTELEFVLNSDGTIDKVGVARSSGLLEYDVAAVDVAYTAGPFPDPPREIRSANGKIYVHWHFFRDERQCATSGADPYILENASAGADKTTALDLPRPRSAGGAAPGGSAPTGAELGGGAPAGATPGAALGGGPPAGGTTEGGPRRLQRFDDNNPAHRAKRMALNGEVAAAEASEGHSAESQPSQPTGPAAAPPNAADPGAQAAALRWFTALAAGDITHLLEMAALPFKTSGKEVSKKDDLSSMLADLASEGIHRPQSVQLVTAARLRAAIGKLPPSLDDTGSGQLYSAVELGSDQMLILILGQRGGSWRPVGMVRR
jgi:TonB family protein